MPDESSVKFQVEIEGVGIFDNVSAWSISQSYNTPADAFQFTVHDNENPASLRRTFMPLQPVRLLINDRVQMLGRIDATNGSGPGGAALDVRGRDYFGAFVDPGIDPSFRVQKGETLEALVLRVLQPYGVTSVSGDGFAAMRNAITGKSSQGTPADFRAIELEAAKPSEKQGVFQFLTQILSRHGFMLQPTQQRWGVALVQPEYSQRAIYSIRVSTSDQTVTNAMASNAQRDYTDVPSITIARSRSTSNLKRAKLKPGEKRKLKPKAIATSTRVSIPTLGPNSPSTIGETPEVKRIFGATAVQRMLRAGETGDPMKVYRPMFYADPDARNQAQLERGLHRELAERLMDTLQYECELPGVAAADGTMYAVDTIAEVDDDVQDVHELLWVHSREVGDNGAGPSTSLRLVRPGSFVL